jgi:asparagine synthase (glutamine-hydrolysing)
VLHPHIVVARERYDRTAAALGIEPRDPFLDLRVIEFCLSLPQEQLQHDGWPKIILRRATKDLLPDAVRWRVGKQHLGGDFSNAFWQRAEAKLATTSSANVQSLLKQDRNASGPNRALTSRRIAQSQQIAYLSLWMDHVTSCIKRDWR